MAGEVNSLRPAALPLHQGVDPKAADQKLRDVAQLYEEQFLREMVKAMRGTVHESGLIKVSQGEAIFKEQLDQKNVESWSKRGGLGFQEIIYKQLLDKFGAKMGITSPQAQVQGPIKLDEKSNYKPVFTPSAHAMQVEYKREGSASPEDQASPPEVQMPFDGKILGVHEFNPNEYVINAEHENGLKSQFSFRGTLSSDATEGANVSAGQRLGYLNPEAQSLFWKVRE